MGVRVILEIAPGSITQEVWSSVFEETLAVLDAHPTGLLGLDTREFEGVEALIYTRSVERDRGDPRRRRWVVAGDRASLRAADSQQLFHDLGHYRRESRDAIDDVLLHAARAKDGAPPLVEVFGGSTHGAPHHVPLLAAAMVVEDRLPLHAAVRGDIDPGQCLRAQEFARAALGRDLRLPARVDAVALHERLRTEHHGRALVRALHGLLLDETVRRHEAVFTAFPAQEAEAWWLDELRAQSLHTLGASWLMVAWLNATGDLPGLCVACCHDPRGPSYSPAAFVDALAELWAGVPHEETRMLDAFRKPAGEPHTAMTLLGSWVLDVGGPGRRLERRFTSEAVREVLRGVFGVTGDALHRLFDDRNEQIRALLRGARERVERFVEQAARDAMNAPEELLTARSADDLTAWQRDALAALATALRNVRRDLESVDPRHATWLYGEATRTRRHLCRLLARRGPTLTEDAWERLAALDDVATLHALVTLAALSHADPGFVQVQRAILENEALARYVTELARGGATPTGDGAA